MMEKCHWELNVLSVGKCGSLEKAVDTRVELTWALNALLQESSKDTFLGVFGVVFFPSFFFYSGRTSHFLIHLNSGIVWDKQGQLQMLHLIHYRVSPHFVLCTLEIKPAPLTPQQVFIKADLETKTRIYYTVRTEKAMTKIHNGNSVLRSDIRILLCVQVTRDFMANCSASSQRPFILVFTSLSSFVDLQLQPGKPTNLLVALPCSSLPLI